MARWRMLYTTGTFYFIATVARWGCGAVEWLHGLPCPRFSRNFRSNLPRSVLICLPPMHLTTQCCYPYDATTYTRPVQRTDAH
eukprot:585046-Prymnesium_polylepis.1